MAQTRSRRSGAEGLDLHLSVDMAARGASSEYARKGLNWTPAYPSWREGFAAL